MAHILTDQNYNQIREARFAGALREIDPKKLRYKDWIVIVCGDGRRIVDILNHQAKESAGEPSTISLFGGALLIAKRSPIPGAVEDAAVIRRHTIWGSRIKGIGGVKLLAHVPCGMADRHDMDFFEGMRLTLEAMGELRSVSSLKPLHFKIECHVDYDGHRETRGGQFRTYHVDVPRMKEMLFSRDLEVRV